MQGAEVGGSRYHGMSLGQEGEMGAVKVALPHHGPAPPPALRPAPALFRCHLALSPPHDSFHDRELAARSRADPARQRWVS